MAPMNRNPETSNGVHGIDSVDMHSSIAEALAKMATCLRSVGLYGRAHPIIEEMVAATHRALAAVLAAQPTVVIIAADAQLILERFPIQDASGCLAALAGSLRQRGVCELTMTAGITRDEVLELAEVLSLHPDDLEQRGGASDELCRRSVSHAAVRSGVLPAEMWEAKDPATIYEEALVLVEETLAAVEAGLHIPVPEIRAVVADSLRSLIHDESALLALAGIRSYDRYLSEHSVNVCILSMVMGRDLGLDAAAVLELGISAMLHDVGKVFVPGEVVRKQGKLSEEEWEQIRRHPADGARALAGLANLPALVSTIALEHHARVDGSGYPSLPASQRPHLLSRLVAVADSYDALTTDRPYRRRWTPEEALAFMLYESHDGYDRQLLARFATRAGLYPVGALAKLRNGLYATVVGGSRRDPRRPTLRVLAGPVGISDQQRVIDLSNNEGEDLEIASIAQPVEALLPYTEKLLRV